MESISVFDIFKIGVGPSSSHTMGPWVAAGKFLKTISNEGLESITVRLYGSLSKTGRGHGTDIAVMLGLSGYHPTTIPVEEIDSIVQNIYDTKTISLGEGLELPFSPLDDIEFINFKLPFHPNALTFVARYADGGIHEETFYSIGGGFVIQEGDDPAQKQMVELPFQMDSERELLKWVDLTGMEISRIVFENELTWRSEPEIREGLLNIWYVMLQCIYRGCHTEGELPGGLNVKTTQNQSKDVMTSGIPR
ncbi:MAG: serine dehydratase beta chain [Saprospiraceae bacterium]